MNDDESNEDLIENATGVVQLIGVYIIIFRQNDKCVSYFNESKENKTLLELL